MQDEFEHALNLAAKAAVAWRDSEPLVPAVPHATADNLRALFDIELAEAGRTGTEVIELLLKAAQPGLLGNTQPNFYAWVQGSSHPVGVAADLLTSAWGQNAGIYQTAPSAAIAEEVSANWLLDLLQLPRASSMAFVTGATVATLTSLMVARSEVLRRANYDLEADGMFGAPPIQVFIGAEAHSTVLAGLRYLGIGSNHLIRIEADDQGRMQVADFEIQLARHTGPKIVILQAGHINSGAFDDFAALVPLARAQGAWTHVDGAFGLWANAVPDLSHLCEGIDQADSWTVDGHKWLQVPYDCGFAIIRDEAAHRHAMSLNASYLVTSPDDGRNPTNYGMELSRRARGFAVWATLQALGRSGVRDMVSRHCHCARELARLVTEVSGIQVQNKVVLNQVAITFGNDGPDDRLTQQVIAKLRSDNQHFVLGASWRGHAILRISVISIETEIKHIRQLAEAIISAWSAVKPV